MEDELEFGNATSTTSSATTEFEFLSSTTDVMMTSESTQSNKFIDRSLWDGFQQVWESPFEYESIVDEVKTHIPKL